jgi:hypothetical protein
MPELVQECAPAPARTPLPLVAGRRRKIPPAAIPPIIDPKE